MKTKIVKNESRKTITVIIAPIVIGYVDYLYKKYNDERYFASAVMQGADYTKDIVPFVKEVIKYLNELGKGVIPADEAFQISDLISMKDDEYRLISKNTMEGKEWDKQFKLNLSSKSKSDEKRFLFKDLAQQQPIPQDDGWKYFYAVELEISVGYDDDNLEKYIYTVFHRAIAIGERDANYKQNDDAWGGFDFKVDKDDLPF